MNKTKLSKEANSSKDLIAIAPLFGAYLLLCGGLYEWFYFREFGIDIFNYLEFTELILAFFNNIELHFILSLVYVSFFLMRLFSLPFARESELNRIPDYATERTQMEISNYNSLISNYTMVIFPMITYFLFEWRGFLFWVFIGSSALLLVVSIAMISNRNIGTLCLYFNVLILNILISLTAAKSDFLVKRNFKQKNLVSFETKNDTYISDSCAFFVGMTKGYVFYFDRELTKTAVIPRTEITRMDIQLSEKWVRGQKENLNKSKK